MSAQSAHLTLRPDRCNECGKCVEACPNDAIRVGADYILVDWHACNQCCACVEACDRNAIQRAIVPLRTTAAVPASVAPADVTKVVVGSRAEAKAVRKAAEKAAKQAGRGGARSPRLSVVAPPAPQAATASGAAMPATAAGAMPSEPPAGRAGAASSARAGTPQSARSSAAPATWYVQGATWGVGDALIVLAVLLATLLAKNAVLGLHAVALMPANARALTRAGVLAIYYGVQIGALVLLAGRHGCTFAQAFGLVRNPNAARTTDAAERPAIGTTALLTFGMLVAVEVVAISYGLFAQAIGWRQPLTLSADVSAVFGGGGVGLALSVLLVALVAPLVEELAFRGAILPAVGARMGAWPAILISAALFAAYHLNLWLFVPMFALGAAAGWLMVARRSLWPAIALHVLYNAVAVAAAFMVPR